MRLQVIEKPYCGIVGGAGDLTCGSRRLFHFYQVGGSLDGLPRDRQIIVTCYTGQQAGQTVAALRLAGFDAISLHGGMTAWDKAKLPLEGSPQNPSDDGGVGAGGAPCATGS